MNRKRFKEFIEHSFFNGGFNSLEVTCEYEDFGNLLFITFHPKGHKTIKKSVVPETMTVDELIRIITEFQSKIIS